MPQKEKKAFVAFCNTGVKDRALLNKICDWLDSDIVIQGQGCECNKINCMNF